MNMDLTPLAHYAVESINAELAILRRTLYRTSKWRVIKRYRLHEKIYKLENDAGLIEHVMLEDEA